MINRNNYESFVIDYLDGTLSPAETAELVLFLEQNPDIAAEVELLNEGIQFVPDQEGFPDKAMLRKDIAVVSDDELDMLMARAIEGDLTAEEKQELDRRISSTPALAQHMKAMDSARLTADAISFDEKASLRMPESVQLDTDEMRLVALLEGDLSKKESDSLRARMDREPALQNDFRMLQSARLTASAEVFEHKQSLYRKKTVVIPLRRALYFTAASAAAVLLFFTVFWQGEPTTANGFALWEPKSWEWLPSDADSPSQEHETESPATPASPQRQDRQTPRMERVQSPSNLAEVKNDDVVKEPSPKFNKLSLIEDAALASYQRNGELKTVTSSIVLPIPDDVAVVPVTQEPQRYPTIIEYFSDKAKQKIFGNEVPEEDVALAVVEKGIKKAVKDDVILSRRSCNNERGFHFKLGKLEICRSRRG